MKIRWIECENIETGLKIERVNFYDDVTLLVGLSGVGKTQILYAVKYSLDLAVNKDETLKPYYVNMGIEIGSDIYEWTYKIDCNKEDMLITEEKQYSFVFERLLCNNELIFERNHNTIKVTGFDKVPQPKSDKSLLAQYAEDESYEKLITGIKKMYSVEMELEIRRGLGTETFNKLYARVKEIMDKQVTKDFKIFSHLPASLKIYIAKRYYKEIYSKIFDAVKEMFVEIEDIDVVEDSSRQMYLVAITVYGKQILQDNISNGMLKTIYYLVELFTMSEDSLVLIDEFENGLGVNCIDVLVEMLLFERRDLQFIITSHHPKIIGGIEKNRWRIIDREGFMVMNRSSEEYGIGDSQHDAYFNLINRWEYEGKA